MSAAGPRDAGQPHISVVIPLFNEESNVHALCERVAAALGEAAWELILVDDGSTDDTLKALRAVVRGDARMRVVALLRNFGQTAAMQAGIDQARGELIVTMDGDLQNDATDIPRMIEYLQANDFDLVVGWRRQRKDNFLLRTLPSRIANALIGRVTGVRLHDYGCSLKVFRGEVLRLITLYGEMHRFIPAWLATVVPPRRIGELEVNHHARTAGASKYGLSRIFRVLIDLLTVLFFVKYQARPGHFFGTVGTVLGVAGGLILAWLGVDKFVLGHDIGGRPLLLVGVLLVLASLQFLTIGVLAEYVTRVYFESTGSKSYVIRESAERDDARDSARAGSA